MTEATILWKRLDVEGNDCCRLIRSDGGWTIEGVSIFLPDDTTTCLRYTVSCDADWRMSAAAVHGWKGKTPVDIRIDRSSAGVWRLNGEEQPVSSDVVDVDLGFTPATNILPIRRLALAIGSKTIATAAYLAFPDLLKLERLEQGYSRLSAQEYAYTAARFGSNIRQR